MTRDLNVSGMHCDGCERRVVDSLREVDGIEDASADHETGTVTVEGDANTQDVRLAVEEAGYTLESRQ